MLQHTSLGGITEACSAGLSIGKSPSMTGMRVCHGTFFINPDQKLLYIHSAKTNQFLRSSHAHIIGTDQSEGSIFQDLRSVDMIYLIPDRI